jgi:hypothetical protein
MRWIRQTSGPLTLTRALWMGSTEMTGSNSATLVVVPLSPAPPFALPVAVLSLVSCLLSLVSVSVSLALPLLGLDLSRQRRASVRNGIPQDRCVSFTAVAILWSERADRIAPAAPALRAKAAPSSSRPLVSKRVSYPTCSVFTPHGEASDTPSSDTTSSSSRPATKLLNRSFDMDPLPVVDHPSRATPLRSLAAQASWDDTSCTRSPRRGAGSSCRTGTRMRRGICG